MIQEFQGRTIRVMGRTVVDGNMLWMASSLSEAGFSVTGATTLTLRLCADATVNDPAARDITPRYAVYLDGEKIRDARMTREEETITVFRSETPRNAEIRLQLMGRVQTEVLKRLIKERFDVEVNFDTGRILYRETIANTVEGVGHLRIWRGSAARG